VNDLATNYASMPVEDIERLALDAQSLTPEARELLRLEMERRQLQTETLDFPPPRNNKPIPNNKKRLVSRSAWIVCAVLSVLMGLSNAAKSGAAGSAEFFPYALGGFIGSLALLAGGWAIIVLVFGLISRLFSRKRPVA
jgi:hypothetical protein